MSAASKTCLVYIYSVVCVCVCALLCSQAPARIHIAVGLNNMCAAACSVMVSANYPHAAGIKFIGFWVRAAPQTLPAAASLAKYLPENQNAFVLIFQKSGAYLGLVKVLVLRIFSHNIKQPAPFSFKCLHGPQMSILLHMAIEWG